MYSIPAILFRKCSALKRKCDRMGLRYHEHRGGGHHQHGAHLGGTEVNLSKLLLGSTRIRRILLVLSFLDILCTRVGISQGHANQGKKITTFHHNHFYILLVQ